VQVVTIKADLLHFQPAPSASESCIGAVDLIGAKVAAQASVRNANMSKGRFIAVLLFPVRADLATLFPRPVPYLWQTLSGVGFSLSSRAGKMASSNETNCFVAGLADETSSQDRDRNPGGTSYRLGSA
jgi:hypothetical protein